MIEDHDAGDEDRREVLANACPFCGQRLYGRGSRGRPWQTPVMAPLPRFSLEDALSPNDLDWRELRGEILTTCSEPACIGAARQFAREHRRDPDDKRIRGIIRAMDRERGLIP